ncbi:MAG: hypothetical protein JO004_00725 [Methylobacteriaceae bacterium]|nr:hypothetical protein [Methylobacteriaceae bacterium]
MPEKIFLTYTNATAVPYMGSSIGHHIVLHYMDSRGVHHTLQGMPEHRFEHNIAKAAAFVQEEALSDGASNRDSPFGRLKAQVAQGNGADVQEPYTPIAEDDDLSDQWDRMTRFGKDVNSIGYEYRPYSQNSNSFAAGALRRGGLFGPGTAFPELFDHQIAIDPETGRTMSVSVPGFDRHITNPLNESASDDFDARFGNWTSAPVGNGARNPGQAPPARGEGPSLSRKSEPYLRGRIAGQLSAAVFDEGAPALPYVSHDPTLAPGQQDSFGDRFGNWASPQANAPKADAGKTPALRGYVVAPDGSRLSFPGPIQASQPPARRSGTAGRSIPEYPLLPLIFGIPNRPGMPDDNMEDWFNRWIKTLRQ